MNKQTNKPLSSNELFSTLNKPLDSTEKLFHIRAYDFGVQFSFKCLQAKCCEKPWKSPGSNLQVDGDLAESIKRSASDRLVGDLVP